jgi:hypothetical protein
VEIFDKGKRALLKANHDLVHDNSWRHWCCSKVQSSDDRKFDVGTEGMKKHFYLLLVGLLTCLDVFKCYFNMRSIECGHNYYT